MSSQVNLDKLNNNNVYSHHEDDSEASKEVEKKEIPPGFATFDDFAEASGTSVNPSPHLFHFTNPPTPDTTHWKTSSLFPHRLQDAKYPPPYETPIFPNFLLTQFTNSCVPMEVFIKRSNELQGIPEIVLRTPDDDSLQKLEILIRQWLSRPPDDKEIMQMVPKLPETRSELLQVLKMKYMRFKKKNPAISTWKKLEECKKVQRNIKKTMKNLTTLKQQYRLKRQMAYLEVGKYACVLAAYKYLLIDTENDALRSFFSFFAEVEALPDEAIPSSLIITAVWYYFELFTAHLSPIIVSSMRAWEKDNNYHVRGEGIYQLRYLPVFKYIEKFDGMKRRNFEDVERMKALLKPEVGDFGGNGGFGDDQKDQHDDHKDLDDVEDLPDDQKAQEDQKDQDDDDIEDLPDQKDQDDDDDVEDLPNAQKAQEDQKDQDDDDIEDLPDQKDQEDRDDDDGVEDLPNDDVEDVPDEISKKMTSMDSKTKNLEAFASTYVTVDPQKYRKPRKFKLEDPTPEQIQKLRDKRLKTMKGYNSRLGLPDGIPIWLDRCEYSDDFLLEYTKKALEFIGEHKMERVGERANRMLKEIKVLDKGKLIDLWQEIRVELIRRKKLLRKPKLPKGERPKKKGKGGNP